MGHTTTATKIKTTARNNQTKRRRNSGPLDYFERKLDDKRRLTIPAEARAEFAGGVVITRGFGTYLHAYPQAVWDDQIEPALKGSILDEHVADLNVRLRTGRSIAALDEKQGRVVIEQHLLEYAGITKDIIAVRAGQYWRLSAG